MNFDYHLNGRMLPPCDAHLSVEDAGFQHAVGLFETFHTYHGQVFRLEQHLDRLARSARELGLDPDLNTAHLADAVQQTIDHNQLDRARLRLTITPGSLSLLRQEADATTPAPTVLIVPSEPPTYDRAYFDQGITVLLAPPGANPFDPMAGHKTLAYWGRLMTLRQAARAGAGEAIWLNITQHLASGAVSNLFLVKDGQLFTPIAHGEEVDGALPSPVLPGITRAAILELAQTMDLKVHQQMLSVEQMLEADEVFLTNTSWLVLPVTRVEKAVVADGNPGPITHQLRQKLLELIVAETT